MSQAKGPAKNLPLPEPPELSDPAAKEYLEEMCRVCKENHRLMTSWLEQNQYMCEFIIFLITGVWP